MAPIYNARNSTDKSTAQAAEWLTSKTNPFKDERVKAALKQQQEPEFEERVISMIMWSGPQFKWTWALYERGERVIELAQQPDEAHADEQAVLKQILALYPEYEHMFAPLQQLALWPSVKAKFQRVPNGRGTKLKLVSFKAEDHDQVHVVERTEQTLRLRLHKYAHDNNISTNPKIIHDLIYDNPDKDYAALCQMLGEPEVSKSKRQDEFTPPSKQLEGTMFDKSPESQIRESFTEFADREEAKEAAITSDTEPPVDELTGKSDETEQPKHWIDNEDRRKQYFATLNGWLDDDMRKAPKGNWRSKWIARLVNELNEVDSDSLHDYPLDHAECQKESWSIVQRHDNAKLAIANTLIANDITPTAKVWGEIFPGHSTFWETVASGTTIQQMKEALDRFIASAKNVTQAPSTPVEPPPVADVSQAPESKPVVNGNGQSSPAPEKALAVVDQQTGEILDAEILDFDPNKAITVTKAKSALVNRLVQDKVLVEGVDYGPVPGTDKPTLLKPGAEKLLNAFGLFDKFTEKAIERDWKAGFFFYEYECTLYDRVTGKAIGSGIGSCNSMEKKYRYRWVTKDRVPKSLDIAELPSKGGKLSEPDFAIEKAESTGKWGKTAAYWQQFKDAIANGTAVTVQGKTKDNKPLTRIEIDTTMYSVPNEDIFDLVNTISKMAQKRALVAAALNATGASAVFTQDTEDFTDFGMIDAA